MFGEASCASSKSSKVQPLFYLVDRTCVGERESERERERDRERQRERERAREREREGRRERGERCSTFLEEEKLGSQFLTLTLGLQLPK